jgi:hypothetical protein
VVCRDLAELPDLRGGTDAMPGTPEKLAVVIERAARGWACFHPDDAAIDSAATDEADVETRQPGRHLPPKELRAAGYDEAAWRFQPRRPRVATRRGRRRDDDLSDADLVRNFLYGSPLPTWGGGGV